MAIATIGFSCKKAENTTTETAVPTNAPAVVTQTPAEETTMPVPPADGKYPVMTFAKVEHDFGIINSGDKVTYTFDFKNTGEADLLITAAKGTCGCTVPEFPKDPIKPGASGKIKVMFNSSGKSGQQMKSVNISTNTANVTETIKIKANITKKDA